MSDTVFDLAVVGGGPGGAASALAAARRGLGVALFEPSRRRRAKPCGEGLMPSGRAALRELGLEHLLVEGRPFDGLRYRVAGRKPLDLDLPSPGLALSRHRLQAALDRAVDDERSIRRVRGAARVARCASRFRIECAGDAFLARTLVAADGLGGATAADVGLGRRRGSSRGSNRGSNRGRVGARAHYRVAGSFDRVEVWFLAGLELYITPLPGDRVNVAVLADDAAWTARDLVADALRRAPEVRARLGDELEPPASRRLGAPAPRRVAADGAFLVGDAGGGVDPVLGCGTTVALRSGLAAAAGADALLAGESPRRVARRYARAYARETGTRRALARALRLLARHPALARVSIDALRVAPAISRGLTARAAGRDSSPRPPAADTWLSTR